MTREEALSILKKEKSTKQNSKLILKAINTLANSALIPPGFPQPTQAPISNRPWWRFW